MSEINPHAPALHAIADKMEATRNAEMIMSAATVRYVADEMLAKSASDFIAMNRSSEGCGRSTPDGLIMHHQEVVGLVVSASEHVFKMAEKDAEISRVTKERDGLLLGKGRVFA